MILFFKSPFLFASAEFKYHFFLAGRCEADTCVQRGWTGNFAGGAGWSALNLEGPQVLLSTFKGTEIADKNQKLLNLGHLVKTEW